MQATPCTARRYDAAQKPTWDAFVRNAKNATFLFERNYMDYHADRFADRSLLIFEGDALVALLPVSERGGEFASHGGLTYGGMISNASMSTTRMLRAFDAALAHLREEGVRRLVYKPVPHIYHAMPAEEDLYALFRAGATLVRRDASSTVDPRARPGLTKGRKWGIKRAAKHGVAVRRSTDFATFMAIEAHVLASRYSATPVHSADELTLLAERFPDNIKLFGAFREDAMIAGVVVYESACVAHAQYIAATDEAKDICATDAILDHLLEREYSGKRYFDFGISTEQQGRHLNAGLIDNKESWGARATVYDFYALELGG